MYLKTSVAAIFNVLLTLNEICIFKSEDFSCLPECKDKQTYTYFDIVHGE